MMARLEKWRNRILPSKPREALNLITGMVSTRYFSEALKDIGSGIITGLVAGLTVARFSSWSPTPKSESLAIFTFALAIMVLALGGVMAVKATIQEKATKVQDVIETKDAAAMVRLLTILILLFILYLLLTIIKGLGDLWS